MCVCAHARPHACAFACACVCAGCVDADLHSLRMWMYERVLKRKERGIQGERGTEDKGREVLRDRDGEFRNYYRSSLNGEKNNRSVCYFNLLLERR